MGHVHTDIVTTEVTHKLPDRTCRDFSQLVTFVAVENELLCAVTICLNKVCQEASRNSHHLLGIGRIHKHIHTAKSKRTLNILIEFKNEPLF